MLLFFDTEFTGLCKDTTLISIGIVSENGKRFYAELTDYDGSQVDDWIDEHVIQNLALKGNKDFLKEYDNLSYYYGHSMEISLRLKEWLKQFDLIQFVSDVCHYDMVLLIDLITHGKTAIDLPKNISAVCHDINQDIAVVYGISDFISFDKSREQILDDAGVKISGQKHNSLYDAEVIKEIYNFLNTKNMKKGLIQK